MESVISQSIHPFQYLVLDDGSHDKTLEIAKEYASKHSWIQVYPNKVNQGAIPNFNRVFDVAQGDFIYTVASDDYLLPGALETISSALLKWPNAGIFCGKMARVSTQGHTLGIEEIKCWTEAGYHTPQECLEEYLLKAPANHSLGAATIYSRSSADRNGRYRAELGHWCDTFLARSIALEEGMVYIPDLFHAWTVDPASLSNMDLMDSRKCLDIIARAAWLMRSGKFRGIFPEEYIAYFERNYRDYIINPILSGYEYKLQQRNQQFFETLSRDDTSDRLLRRLFSWFLKLEDKFLTRRIRQYSESLRNYPGDISCYTQSAE